ncbi:hypothetical protein [Bacillus velezensis]|uniref:hypothetical protein n=1 Tax=Bacillus velezensis TaxID=492670 RepID=UPI001A92ECFE|nr:hypothetical protein [Bacillus velezensis]
MRKHLEILYAGFLMIVTVVLLFIGLILGVVLLAFLVVSPFTFFSWGHPVYASLVLAVDFFIIVYLIGLACVESGFLKRGLELN